eukprot:GHVU01081839.1.p1 GENE.GHVU01081839.1~~GHVU01081839.1.p1  ORF type:complete len:115 (-),score=8.97 GHVU01081839.1:507-851(-)
MPEPTPADPDQEERLLGTAYPYNPPTAPPNYVPRLRAFAYATHNDGYFDALCESARRMNLDFTVLDFGQPWRGFRRKMECIYQFAAAQYPEDIVSISAAFLLIGAGCRYALLSS